MGRVRNRRYKLTWCHRERRWRRIYKGRPYYFPIRDDETKESSYERCLECWENLKRKLDAEAFSPHRSRWEGLLQEQIKIMDNCKAQMSQLEEAWDQLHHAEQLAREEQIRGLRQQWRTAFFFAHGIRENLKSGAKFPSGTGSIPDTAMAKMHLLDKETSTPPQQSQGPPPWQGAASRTSRQLGANIDRFLEAKAAECSNGHVRKLRQNLHPFTEYFGETRSVPSLDSQALSEYRTHILQRMRADAIGDDYASTLLIPSLGAHGPASLEGIPRILPYAPKTIQDRSRALTRRVGVGGGFKMPRATASDMLRDHPEHRIHQEQFLGHSARTMAEIKVRSKKTQPERIAAWAETLDPGEWKPGDILKAGISDIVKTTTPNNLREQFRLAQKHTAKVQIDPRSDGGVTITPLDL